MGNCVGVLHAKRRGKEAHILESLDPLEESAATPGIACVHEQSVVEVVTPPSAPSRSSSSSSSSSLNETLRSRASASGSHYSLPLAVYVLRETQDVTDRYTIAEQIGFGQYGIVRVAIDKRTGIKYAIKTISKIRAQQDHHDYCQRIRTEVEILYHLGGHSNIVQLYDVFEDADTIHLIMELCEGGDWFDQLLAGGAFTETQAARAVQSVLRTLTYCHGLEVAHRDIKPENLLYTSRSANAAIKLADFGLSSMIFTSGDADDRVGVTGSGQVVHKVVGSAIYMSPEVLTSHGANKERDIWSLGVVLYITLSGYPPFDGNNMQEVFDAILTQPLRFDDPSWEHISAEAKDFISRMLCKDPKKRASIDALLSHPWMQSINGEGAADKLQAPARQAALPDTVVTRLHQFAAMNRFKKEARKVLAAYLPTEEVAGLRHIFQEMDVDGDGLITLAELRSVLAARRLFLTDAQSQDMLQCADLNNNGVIDYEEFLAATINDLHLAKDELVMKAFKHFDRGGTGFITRQDLREALSYQGMQIDLDSIMDDVDQDGDELINYQEFSRCLRDNDQSFEASLWPLLSTSLSMRRSFLSSRGRVSMHARGSLTSSASAKRQARQRTVHFKESFRNSLQSVRECGSGSHAWLPPGRLAAALAAGPPAAPGPRPGDQGGAAAAAQAGSRSPSPTFIRPAVGSSDSLSMLAPAASQVVKAVGHRASRPSPPPTWPVADGGESLSTPAPPGAWAARASDPGSSEAESRMSSRRSSAAVKGEVEARLSSRRGSALMKSIMMDCEQMQGLMSSRGSFSTAVHAAHRPRQTPARAPRPLGMLVRDASCTPLKHGAGAADASKLRARTSRASMSGVATAAAAGEDAASASPTVFLPPINVPSCSPLGACSQTPTQHTPQLPAARAGRPSARSCPGACTPAPAPRCAPQLQAGAHAPCPPGASPDCSSASKSKPASPRGRSPSARARRSIYRSLGRSLSRSKPSRQASRGSSTGVSRGSSRAVSRGSSRGVSRGSSRGVSRGSSRAVSRGSSKGMSRGSSTSRPSSRAGPSNGHSRCSSRGSARALSRSSSRALSRLASAVSRTAPSASSPQRLPRVPSPHGSKTSDTCDSSGAFPRARGPTSRSSSHKLRAGSLPGLPPGQQPALPAARMRSDLYSSPDAALRLLARMASSRDARARNSSMQMLGADQLLMASGSLGRPSSAMLASILTEWENELGRAVPRGC